MCLVFVCNIIVMSLSYTFQIALSSILHTDKTLLLDIDIFQRNAQINQLLSVSVNDNSL